MPLEQKAVTPCVIFDIEPGDSIGKIRTARHVVMTALFRGRTMHVQPSSLNLHTSTDHHGSGVVVVLRVPLPIIDVSLSQFPPQAPPASGATPSRPSRVASTGQLDSPTFYRAPPSCGGGQHPPVLIPGP